MLTDASRTTIGGVGAGFVILGRYDLFRWERQLSDDSGFSINVLKFLSTILAVYVLIVRRSDTHIAAGDRIVLIGDNDSALYWVYGGGVPWCFSWSYCRYL